MPRNDQIWKKAMEGLPESTTLLSKKEFFNVIRNNISDGPEAAAMARALWRIESHPQTRVHVDKATLGTAKTLEGVAYFVGGTFVYDEELTAEFKKNFPREYLLVANAYNNNPRGTKLSTSGIDPEAAEEPEDKTLEDITEAGEEEEFEGDQIIGEGNEEIVMKHTWQSDGNLLLSGSGQGNAGSHEM